MELKICPFREESLANYEISLFHYLYLFIPLLKFPRASGLRVEGRDGGQVG